VCTADQPPCSGCTMNAPAQIEMRGLRIGNSQKPILSLTSPQPAFAKVSICPLRQEFVVLGNAQKLATERQATTRSTPHDSNKDLWHRRDAIETIGARRVIEGSALLGRYHRFMSG
jgi:hypothetical protein